MLVSSSASPVLYPFNTLTQKLYIVFPVLVATILLKIPAHSKISQKARTSMQDSHLMITVSLPACSVSLLPMLDSLALDISQSSVLGLLRSIRTVLAWQTSARHIFKKARSFQTSVPAFYRYCYHDRSLQPIPIAVNVATTLLESWHAQRTDDSKLPPPRFVLNITLHAKVHCEATLMHWIATVQVRFLSSMFMSPLLIFS